MEACFRQLKDKVEKQYGVRAVVSHLLTSQSCGFSVTYVQLCVSVLQFSGLKEAVLMRLCLVVLSGHHLKPVDKSLNNEQML